MQRPAPLAQGVTRRGLLGQGQHRRVLTEREEPKREVVARRRAQPFEPGALGEDIGVVGEVGVRRAAPPPQRLLETFDLLLDLASTRPRPVRPGRQLRGEPAEHPVPGPDLVGERRRVDRVAGEREPVALVGRDQHRRLRPWLEARFEQPSQPGDIGVQRPVGTGRRLVTPHERDEPVRGHDRSEVEREGGEERAPLARRDLDGPVGPVERRRPEDAHLHRHPGHATDARALPEAVRRSERHSSRTQVAGGTVVA